MRNFSLKRKVNCLSYSPERIGKHALMMTEIYTFSDRYCASVYMELKRLLRLLEIVPELTDKTNMPFVILLRKFLITEFLR